ncbi:MAG: FtsX-like permease family protein [Clostridia bacterium]|nr:FtsX-like permease family protein [Clostridia bacterium]
MKVSSILSLSVKNIFLKKFAYLKVLAGFFFAFLIIFIVLFYSGSLSIAYKTYENNNADCLHYYIGKDVSAEEELEIRAFPQVKSIWAFENVSFANNSVINLQIGGSAFEIAERSFYEILISPKSDYMICENDEIYFTAQTGENVILYGTQIKKHGDIVISEDVLDNLGITEREELLGKEISFSGELWAADGEEGYIYNESGIICGISNEKLGRYSVSASVFGFLPDGVPAAATYVELKSFTGNEDFFAKMDAMFGEQVMHTFVGSGILDDMKIVEGQEMLCNRFLSIICTVLIAVIAIYVASNQYYLLLKNSVFYGILKANGVSNREVFLMHTFELAITLIVALIIAFGASVGLFFVIKELFYSLMSIDLIFPAGAAVASFFGFFAACAALAVLITLFIYVKILKKPPVRLLRK